NNLFRPGDKAEIVVTNKSGKDIYIELIVSNPEGKIHLLAPHTTVVKAGQAYRWGPFPVGQGLGKEQITLFASDAIFPAGELLQGKDVTDRFVHPFYALDRHGKQIGPRFDPGRMLKKTIDIETR